MRRFAFAPALVVVVALGPWGSGSIRTSIPTSGPASSPATSARARVVPGGGFVTRPCPDGVFPPKVAVDCGFIRVPQDRSRPHGRTIKVAAAVVHSTSTAPAADPILVLPGGPSAAAITPFYYANYFDKSSWASDHDLVLVDTRGTGSSTPRLGCPEEDRAEVRLFYNRPFVGGRARTYIGGALRDCRRRLVRRGIRPAAYTSSASVADLEALRTALGVSQWDLLAISADGVLGMSYVREHPESIRATIVDSGLSPQMEGSLDYERGLSEELDTIFAGCAANHACRTRYPHLRRAFLTLVARLNAHPRVIRFPDFRPHPVRTVIDGAGAYRDALSEIFPGNRVAPDNIHRLIDDMWRESHGELAAVYRESFGTGPVTNPHSDQFVALGKTMSYECHDVTDFITAADRRRAARDLPMFARRYLSPAFDFGDFFADPRSPAGCRIWRVGRAAPAQHRPVASGVPTLVLAGEFDIGVPPFVVRQIDDRLTASTYVEFPASAHLQLAAYNVGSDCARSIAQAFLRSPTDPPDTSCVQSLPGFDFTPPRSLGRRAIEPRGGLPLG